MYPEFVFQPDEFQAFMRDRRGAVVGRQLADLYGFKVGDTIPLKSGIYPGNWEFNVRAIYDAKDETTITRQMYFHYDYLNEQLKKTARSRADFAGVFRRRHRRWTVGARHLARDRCAVQELAGRDTDRDGEGIYVEFRRNGRNDHYGDRRR